MIRYTIQRVIYMVITMFVIIAISFFAMKIMPGTPFKNVQKLSPSQLQTLNHEYGFDKPIPVQFVKYLDNVIHGNFGLSFQFQGRPVAQIVAQKLPVSANLGFEALVVGVIIGIILGILAALRRGKVTDYGTTIVAVLGISIPGFVAAILLQVIFAMDLHWFPVAEWGGWKYHVLPVAALSFPVIATIARFMRTEMVEVLNEDYIEMARAKGMSRLSVTLKHAVRNSMIPIITIVGPLAVAIMTGILVIENIFAIPGIGDQFVTSITTNDYPMIMAVTIMFAAAFILVIFIVDVLYGIIDPRIRLAGGDS